MDFMPDRWLRLVMDITKDNIRCNHKITTAQLLATVTHRYYAQHSPVPAPQPPPDRASQVRSDRSGCVAVPSAGEAEVGGIDKQPPDRASQVRSRSPGCVAVPSAGEADVGGIGRQPPDRGSQVSN